MEKSPVNNHTQKRRGIILLLSCLFAFLPSAAYELGHYNADHPVTVVCDWDKPPYEFMNGQGQPAGSNIDVLEIIFKELDIPYRFIMKEWGNAVKTFERGEADLIMANIGRYTKNGGYYWTNNIINYNRIVAAANVKTPGKLSIRQLAEQGVVLKPSDFTIHRFLAEDSAYLGRLEIQSPKVAIMGLVAGDYNYFVWGEEPIKWKLKELNIDGIVLNEVDIPISEIHVVGRDHELIEAIDDYYSRMKQRGELEEITNRWFHPERVTSKTSPVTMYIIIGLLVILAGVVIWLANRFSKTGKRRVIRELTNLDSIMYKALHMGNFHIMQYDIATDRMTNRYGKIVREEGMTMEEFCSRIHPDEVQEFRQDMARMLSGDERKTELKKRWNAGTWEKPQWVILGGNALLELDEDEKPACIVFAVQNVTYDAEDKLSTYEMKKKYEVLSNMPGIATSFYDRNGYLMEFNENMSELCGMKNDPNAERFWKKVCIFDVPLFLGILLPGSKNELYACQHMHYPEMGLNRYIELHVRPLFNTQGELSNYFCSVLDITDEHECLRQLLDKQAETVHSEQCTQFYEHQLTELVDSDDLYIWHSDIVNNTICFYKSLRNQHLVEMSIDEFVSYVVENEQDVVRYYFTNTNDEQSEMNAIFHFNHTVLTDEERWFNMKSTPLRDAQGHVIGHHGISYDVTNNIMLQRELREVTRRAEASNQMKSAFMASMTHELRTPLNAVVGFTDVLRMTEEPEERAEYIRIVRNSSDMLVRLINDIFEASIITAGPDSIKPVDVDFAKAFDDICLMLEQRVSESGLTFIKENPYETFPATLDIGRIQQIITNFVTNAVKFTKQGHIRVGYKQAPCPSTQESENNADGLYIYCEDTGYGIPKDKQEQIFDRFVKLDEYAQGTGLGLNICKSIAERCGGHVGVNSEGEGHGSTFWFWIPVK